MWFDQEKVCSTTKLRQGQSLIHRSMVRVTDVYVSFVKLNPLSVVLPWLLTLLINHLIILYPFFAE